MSALVPRQSPPPPPFCPAPWSPIAGWVAELPGEPQLREAGHHWDAVRIDGDLAGAVYRVMSDATHGAPGPVLINPGARRHYWFLNPGSTRRWDVFPGVACRSKGSWVVVVPASRTNGPWAHWLSPPGPDGRRANAALLHATLRALVGV